MLKTKEETKEPKLRAVFDGRCLPIELFGSGPNAPHKRKLIWNYIATYANPDGTSAFPGRNTIAAHNGVTPSTVTKITKWLEQHHLLKVEYKASRHNTNCYSVLFSEEAQDACRAQLAETQGELRDKAEQNHRARSTAAKSRWAKQNADREYSIPCVELAHSEYSIPRAADSTGNTAFPIDGESFASDRESFASTQGIICMGQGMQHSPNRPLDRPKLNRPTTPSTTPTAQKPNADGVVVDAELVSSKSQPQPLGHGWNESEQRDKEIKQHRATSPKSNSTALDKPNGDGESDIERIRFVGELRTIWEKHRGNKIHPLKITKEQGKEAFALAIAEEYGLRLFYAAWEYWVTTANLLIVTSNDKITGEDKKEFVAYPLQHFINSGEATARMKEVRPFLHLAANSYALRFLIEVCDLDEAKEAWSTITPKQAALLSKIAAQLDTDELQDRFTEDEYPRNVNAFLSHVAKELELEPIDEPTVEVAVMSESELEPEAAIW